MRAIYLVHGSVSRHTADDFRSRDAVLLQVVVSVCLDGKNDAFRPALCVVGMARF